MSKGDGLQIRAQIAFERGQWTEAVDLYRQVCHNKQAGVAPRLKLARALDHIKEYDSAKLLYTECSQRHPDVVDAHIEAGAFFQRCNNIVEAATYFGRALCVQPGHEATLQALTMMGIIRREQIDYYSLQGGLVGEDAGRRPRHPLRKKLALPLVELAMAAMRKKDWDRAEIYFSNILRFVPDYTAILVQFGHCLREKEKFSDALIKYRRAILLFPRDPDIYLHLGHALKGMGFYLSALDSYSTSLMLRPCFIHAQVEVDNLKRLLQLRGMDVDALIMGQTGIVTSNGAQEERTIVRLQPDNGLDEHQRGIFFRLSSAIDSRDQI